MKLTTVTAYFHNAKPPDSYTMSNTVYTKVDLATYLGPRGRIKPYDASIIDAVTSVDGAILAGGFVASLLKPTNEPSDIDVFFTNSNAFIKVFEALTTDYNSRGPTSDSALGNYTTDVDLHRLENESHTLRVVKLVHKYDKSKLPIQLIKMFWFDSPEHVIDSFDFTSTQFAINNNKQLVYNPLSLSDLMEGRLVINKQQYPMDMVYRMMKYARKGFVMPASEIKKVVEAIRKNPTSNMSILDFTGYEVHK